MSTNWVQDIQAMQDKFGVREWVKNHPEHMKEFLQFRLEFLAEELGETLAASAESDPEEIVDGLIDICVVAIGNLLAFGVDAQQAWDVVHEANMQKVPGKKKERPNPLGLPDLMKPEGWKNPSHKDNHGDLTDNI